MNKKPARSSQHLKKIVNNPSNKPQRHTQGYVAPLIGKEDYSPESPNQLNGKARKLLMQCELHQKYSQQQLKVEEQKYQEYYRSLCNSIQHHYEEGMHIIRDKQKTVMETFEKYKRDVLILANQLKIGDCYRGQSHFHKMFILQDSATLQFQFLQVELPDFKTVEKEITRYLPKPIYSCQPYYAPDSPFSKASSTVSGGQGQAVDFSDMDSLACDQDLSMEASAGSMRRRKYAVLRGQVIAEEDEWEESSSLVSD